VTIQCQEDSEFPKKKKGRKREDQAGAGLQPCEKKKEKKIRISGHQGAEAGLMGGRKKKKKRKRPGKSNLDRKKGGGEVSIPKAPSLRGEREEQ